jgi:hypothetical protein
MEKIGAPKDHLLMSQVIFGYPLKKEITAPERREDVVLNWIN